MKDVRQSDNISQLPVASIEWFADIAEFRNEPVDVTMQVIVPHLDRMMASNPVPQIIPPLRWPTVAEQLRRLPEYATNFLVLGIEPFLDLYVTGRREIGVAGESMLFGICCYPEEPLDADRGEVFLLEPSPDGLAMVLPQARVAEPPTGKTINVRYIRSVTWLSEMRPVHAKWRSASRKRRRS
jgi:hypothetical protein